MKNNQKLVSVVIPCYNLGQYLEEAIKSVEIQTYKNIEITIVDDGSTDKNTIELLKKIKSDKHINVIFQKNMGPSGARNTGINIARGDYILCLDSDDILSPEYIEKVMQIFERDSNHEIGFVTTWIQEFGLRDNIWETEKYNPGKLLVQNIVASSSIFKKEAWEMVGGYKVAMKGGYEDWEFWISVVEYGYKWALLPETLFLYRIREKSVSSVASSKHLELYKKIIDFHPKMFKKYANDVAYISSDIINNLRIQSDLNTLNANVIIDTQNKDIKKLIKENRKIESINQEYEKYKSSKIIKLINKILR